MGEVAKLEQPKKMSFKMGMFYPGPNGESIPNFLGPIRKLMSYKGYRNQGLVIRLIKLEKFIAEQMDIFGAAHQKLLDQHQVKNEDGSPKVVVDGDVQRFEIGDKKAFEEQWKELLATPVETDMNKFPFGYFQEVDLSPNEFGKLTSIIAFPEDSGL